MNGLGACYSWEDTFTPPAPCSTAPAAQSACPDATWFWVVLAIVAGVAIVNNNK